VGCLRSGVNHPRSSRGILRRGWDQSPAKHR